MSSLRLIRSENFGPANFRALERRRGRSRCAPWRPRPVDPCLHRG
ncbi:MAG: hypothetical protein WA441_03575 [Methyloceanibacter sp.]